MGDKKEQASKNSFLFNVSIMIEGNHNGAALEALLRILNSSSIIDYKVNEGIELGKIIDTALSGKQKEKEKEKEKETAPATGKPPVHTENVPELLNRYQQTNTLVRLSVLKGKGVHLSMPCRVLRFDADSQLVTVYHVDEKKVYQFHLNEIEDFHTQA